MCVTMTAQQVKFVVFCWWLIAYMAVIHTNWLCSVCEGVQVAQAECVRECTAAVYTLQYPLCLWCQWAMLTLALWLCFYWNNTVITELRTTYSTVLSYVLHTVQYWVMYYIQYSTELCTTYSTGLFIHVLFYTHAPMILFRPLSLSLWVIFGKKAKYITTVIYVCM